VFSSHDVSVIVTVLVALTNHASALNVQTIPAISL